MITHTANLFRAVMLGVLCFATGLVAQSPPVITGVTAAQQPLPSKLVNIAYTISDPDSTSINIAIFVSKDSGVTWDVPALSFTGDGAPGNGITVSATPTAKSVVWDAGADWDGHFTNRCRVRVQANDSGLVGVPAGSFLRGTPAALGDTDITNAPQHSVFVSAFWIDSKEVTGALWVRVKEGYAVGNGYVFTYPGVFKAISHPVHSISWFDAVKWCNARSEMEGRMPVYYTSAAFTTVFKTGTGVPFEKPGANGYRLPTEAEWEKAARGGFDDRRFPWGDTITHSDANYFSRTPPTYDVSPTRGNHPAYNSGPLPYTSPAGSFLPNGYGLFDMVGNVGEWCWDWWSASYYTSGQRDPRGPGSGSYRVHRGGDWGLGGPVEAARCRLAYRQSGGPAIPYNTVGFRVVLAPGSP